MVTEYARNSEIKATPIVAMENEQKEESNISEHPDDCNESEVCTCLEDCEDPETIDGNYSFYLPKE